MTESTEVPRRHSRLRRAGCIIALLIWFAILLLPCFLVVLAVQGEITVSTGGAPGQQTRLWLISEADERGLAISSASVTQTEPNALCVQTDVRFLLWSGKAEPSVYCECYVRENADTPWAAADTISGACIR